MPVLFVLPAIVSLLILAAHFLHNGGNFLLVIPCLALCLFLFSHNRWMLYIVQIALILATIEWIFTAIDIVQVREQTGLPYMRAAIIISSVAALNLIAAVLLRYRNRRAV